MNTRRKDPEPDPAPPAPEPAPFVPTQITINNYYGTQPPAQKPPINPRLLLAAPIIAALGKAAAWVHDTFIGH
jgi:hypothetical protein